MRKHLSCIALCLAAPIGAHAEAPDQPQTPEGYYALGEKFGKCAAFFSFMSQGALKAGKQEMAANLAQRRGDWSLATVVFLGFGHAADATGAGQTIMDAEVNRLQARFDANPNTDAILTEMIADHHKQCDPLEPLRDGAVEALKRSIQGGVVVRPTPER